MALDLSISVLQVVHDLAGWKVRTIACGSGTYALAAGVPGDPDNSTVTWYAECHCRYHCASAKTASTQSAACDLHGRACIRPCGGAVERENTSYSKAMVLHIPL